MDMRKGSGAALVGAFPYAFSVVLVKQATGMLMLQGSESRMVTNRHSSESWNPSSLRSLAHGTSLCRALDHGHPVRAPSGYSLLSPVLGVIDGVQERLLISTIFMRVAPYELAEIFNVFWPCQLNKSRRL
jgi:hypothetical protein